MRVELEEIIIGAVLLENKYNTVAHILSYKNFSELSTINYRLIWGAIEEMHCALLPCDIITLTLYIRQKKGANYAAHISRCCNRIASAENLQYYAVNLFEIDLKTKTEELLLKHVLALENSPEARAVASSILNTLKNNDADILQILPTAVEYLHTTFYPEEYHQQLIDLYDEIPDKVKTIKKLSQIKNLFDQLNKIHDLAHSTKTQIALKLINELVNKLVFNQTANTDEVINRLTETLKIYG